MRNEFGAVQKGIKLVVPLSWVRKCKIGLVFCWHSKDSIGKFVFDFTLVQRTTTTKKRENLPVIESSLIVFEWMMVMKLKRYWLPDDMVNQKCIDIIVKFIWFRFFFACIQFVNKNSIKTEKAHGFFYLVEIYHMHLPITPIYTF